MANETPEYVPMLRDTTGAKSKGYLKNLDTSLIMKFQYNPETFEHSRGATYAEIVAPGMSYPELQYVHGNARTFSVELFLFDKPYTGTMDNLIGFLEELLPPEDNDTDYTKPPKVLISYGTFVKKCVVEDLQIKAEEYDSSLNMVVVRANITFRQV